MGARVHFHPCSFLAADDPLMRTLSRVIAEKRTLIPDDKQFQSLLVD